MHTIVKPPKLTLDAQISSRVASFQPEVPELLLVGHEPKANSLNILMLWDGAAGRVGC